jgi:GT2 family glycosyltransferase
MVVHEPGVWFAETLASLAAQDYPDLRLVALLTSTTPATVADAIQVAVPAALVRFVEGNPGFGPVANQVMAVVDGHDGFLLFLHDDVALQPDVVSQLVAEAFRSNAAMVGPKLVEWDTPSVLQHVGLDADRTGRLVDVVDPGERDQQQHDAVRDTFALPSACMLVRNDIFREVGGFAAQIPFLGEERDVCWRLHMLGARVMVNPAAVVRHRGAFATRAMLIGADARAERNRVRTVVACAPLSQLPLVVVRLLVQSIVDTVLGLLNGEQQRGLASD